MHRLHWAAQYIGRRYSCHHKPLPPLNWINYAERTYKLFWSSQEFSTPDLHGLHMETAGLQPFWDVIVRSGLLDEPLFEAYVAAFSFFVWTSLFHLLKINRRCSKWRFPSRNVSVPFEQSDLYTVLSLPVYLLAIKLLHTFKAKTRPNNEGEWRQHRAARAQSIFFILLDHSCC